MKRGPSRKRHSLLDVSGLILLFILTLPATAPCSTFSLQQQQHITPKKSAAMAPSLNAHSSFTRPRTSDRDARPSTRDQGDTNLIIPSRTSSLHSRITQPIPSTLNMKPQQRTPKTLTHAYMVCGVGREPSQWIKAPQPAQGKIGHMKGAVGQFWLPEILGSSPRLEQDNEMARALHAAMRVSLEQGVECRTCSCTDRAARLAFLMMSNSALDGVRL